MTHWRSHFHTRCLWFLTFLLTLFSPSLTAQATATSSSSNANVGLVGFIFPSEELVEGNFVHFVGVKRTNGSSGAVRCNISIVTSNDVHDAEEGKDYLLLSNFVAFEDGDPDPKAVVLRFFNDQKLETVSYVRLSIACLPEEANGLILQHTLKISDDRDGGIIKLPRNIIPMQEDLLFFPPAESERCVLSVERAGGSSGTAKILVHWHTTPVCAEDDEWPAISEDALFKVDWSYLEGTGSVSWDDGESGVKCAVEKYWLQNFSSTNGSNASAVVVYSDGLVETAEGFCGYITADVGSAAIIPEPSGRLPFAMLIRDRGKTGGGEHRCIKGAECPLNLTLSIAVAFLHQAGNWTFVQAAGHGVQCLPCSIGINQSSCQNLPLHQFRVEGQRFEWAAADLGTSLSNETPGDRSVCMCRDGDPDNATHQIATLVLAGPEGDNTASCFKNQHSCAVRLREIRTTGGQNHLRIMPSCEDYELTPPGFVEGAVAVADETSFWYEMSDTDKMRLEAAGIYKLCWCHSFSPSDCTQLSDFNVEAGSFIYAGPYEVVSLREVRIPQVLKVEVSGIGLSSDDEAMLLVTCGMGQPILRAGKIQERFFNFGVLGSHGNEVAAGSYQLCWCQPSLGRS